MIAYIDTSVLLRVVLRESTSLREWNAIDLGVVSPLVMVECHRTLDRLWLTHQLNEEEVSAARMEAGSILGRFMTLPLDNSLLDRAAGSMPLPIRTLDALHLVSAMLFREAQPPNEQPILMATHDHALAKVARAMNLDVIGVDV